MAEPRPAPEKSEKPREPEKAEKPSLSVAPAPDGGAAAKPAAGAGPQPQKDATAAAPREPQQAPRQQASRSGTRWGTWLLALLVAGAVVVAWVQTERLSQAESRVTALSDRVLGLEAQLSAAETRIDTFEMERAQVREAVSDITQRVLMLGELVGGASEAAPPAPADAPEADAAP